MQKISTSPWFLLGISLLFVAACRNGASDFAKLDIPTPALAPGWVQFRHEPGGYTFQTPASWVVDPKAVAPDMIERAGSDANLFIRIADLDAARRGDLVTFAILRMSSPGRDKFEVMNLDDLAKKALAGMQLNSPDVKHERMMLPIGPAEHLWSPMDKTMPDGSHVSMTSNIVVFATALRPFVLMYGYPTSLEAKYRPTLDAMVPSVRLILPNKDGVVDIPASARVPRRSTPSPAVTYPAPYVPPITAPPPVVSPIQRYPNPVPVTPGQDPPNPAILPPGAGNPDPTPAIPDPATESSTTGPPPSATAGGTGELGIGTGQTP